MNSIGIKRVLVALDTEREAQSALQYAAEIAARLQVGLLGLFVEDEDLLALSDLPIARELAYAASNSQTLTRNTLERSLQHRAQRLRREMESVTTRWKVEGQLQILRGQVAQQLLANTQQEDLLILGRVVKQRVTQQFGRVTQTIWQQATCSLALMPTGSRLERPVVVLVEDTQTSMKALDLAIQLARADDYHLSVLIPNLPAAQQDTVEAHVLARLHAVAIPPHILRLRDNQAATVFEAVRQQRGRLFILPVMKKSLPEEAQ